MRRLPTAPSHGAHWLASTFFFVIATSFPAQAEGRPGGIDWSDGRKMTGAISLTAGKDIRIFANNMQSSLQLDEIREIRFKPEKEEMWEGFYFPNAGQATQVKTGEVYPIRYLATEIILSDGKVLDGHLFTTTFYVESDAGTQKVVVMAKQSGLNGQKLTDLPYPTDIHFDAGPSAGASLIDLTQTSLPDVKQIVVVAKPDLGFLPATQSAGKNSWSVPMGTPQRILFSVESSDGIHVAWPDLEADPEPRQAVQASLKVMRDFFDTRDLLGCFADTDNGDIYSLVMLKRLGTTYSFAKDKIPWNLVILRWKYDPDEKKTTLLNRVALARGRIDNNSPAPQVFKSGALLQLITAQTPTTPAPAQP